MKVRLETYEAIGKADGSVYNDLTKGNVYRVIGIEADMYRIMSDEGLPFLYPPEIFTIIDASEPKDWETNYGEEGERYAYPKELNAPGFFEDYFDYDKECMKILRLYLFLSRQSTPPLVSS